MSRWALVVAAVLVAFPPLPALASNGVTRIEIKALAGPGVEVRSINNRGTIVGSIWTPPAAVPFRWTQARGVERFLGGSPGYATDINDMGAIVGVLVNASGRFISGFLWTPHHGVVRLGSFLPAAINNRGQIAGSCSEVPGVTRPCLWEDGAVTELGDGVDYGGAFDINERGRVAGQLLLSGFVWSRHAGLNLLSSSSGGADDVTAAMAINDRSEAVGFEVDYAVSPSVSVPVRWTPGGKIRPFPHLNGTFVAINASGLAAGRYLVESAPTQFVWYGFASIRDRLVSLGPGLPVAVNDWGTILGTTVINGTPRVVVWFIGSGKRFEHLEHPHE